MEYISLVSEEYGNLFAFVGFAGGILVLFKEFRSMVNRAKDSLSKINKRTRLNRMWKLRKIHNHIRRLKDSDRKLILFIGQILLVMVVLLSLFIFIGFLSILMLDSSTKPITIPVLSFMLILIMLLFFDAMDVIYELKDPEEGCKKMKRRIREIRDR